MNSLPLFNQVREVLYFPPLTIDAGARRAMMNGETVPLTKNEFDILLLLARTPEMSFSPNKIYSEIWNMPDLQDIRTVRVHVSRLRKKLKTAFPSHEFIKLIWGEGYVFAARVEGFAQQGVGVDMVSGMRQETLSAQNSAK